MTLISIVLLAVALAMDATAVAAAKGLALARILPKHVFTVALFFGGFQALMPLLGWWLGVRIGPLVEAWDHWVAFVLLAGIGGKMLWEAREAPSESEPSRADGFDLKSMLLLAIATSIDAMAAGVTLPMLGAPLAFSLATIGVTTAVLSVAGLYAGRRFGAFLGRKLDAFGGVVLVALGTKILVQHLAL